MQENLVPPPSDEDKSPPKWLSDNKAKSEEALWGDDDALRGQVNKNQMMWLKVYGLIVPAMMLCFSAFYISALGAWAWHYITPWSWLTAEQLSKIQSIIFSGSIGAFIASVAQKHALK